MFNCCADRECGALRRGKVEKKKGGGVAGTGYGFFWDENRRGEKCGKREKRKTQTLHRGRTPAAKTAAALSAIVKLSAFKKMDEITYSPAPVAGDSNCCRRLNKI